MQQVTRQADYAALTRDFLGGGWQHPQPGAADADWRCRPSGAGGRTQAGRIGPRRQRNDRAVGK